MKNDRALGLERGVVSPRDRRARRQQRRRRFSTSHTEIVLAGLAQCHDGVRIAHLSDLHVGLGTPDGRIRAAIHTINLAAPDLVVMTGDYVTWQRTMAPLRLLTVLDGIEPPVFATLGNHDHWVDATVVRQTLEDLGYHVLQNSHAVALVRGAPLVIVGIDDGFSGHDDVAASFADAPPGGCVVLTHAPSTAELLPPGQGLLCLAGHTHGGQVVIPGVSRNILKLTGERFMAGLHEVAGNTLYVNRGLGFGRGGIPRIGAPPELALFTLRSG